MPFFLLAHRGLEGRGVKRLIFFFFLFWLIEALKEGALMLSLERLPAEARGRFILEVNVIISMQIYV